MRFPVEIVPFDPRWFDLFDQERKLILNTLGEQLALRVEHFGSTSIPELPAKPTIDILVEIPTDERLHDDIITKLVAQNYDFMWQTDAEPPYMVFVKGYNVTGAKQQTYHIHMGPQTHALWDRLYFRDYLREKPMLAKAYAELKNELAKVYRNDRVAYRLAKTDFVKTKTEEAKQYYVL
ncbi:UPF0157 protein [Fibrella aestuarina BUZ 2]|uniref:UPF0157 protein n=2 Tax=Fibrella TaxID=861914 RepID=I0KC39_9BACT|nr:UPF0157 protein [Fibrella aestuarina BUZ 2]